MQPDLDILLPTYNGSEYIKQLMDSLCRQSWNRFTLLTYDDGSTDDTARCVDAYRDRLQITRIGNPDGTNRGALKSFELLMDNSTAECMMFCDQDDIWNEQKVEKCLSVYSLQKKRFGSIPLLLFSDCSLVTDDGGNPSKNSFLSFQGINTRCVSDPYYLVFRNPAPGCSMLINRALAGTSLPIGDTAIMHDWWIIINAAIQGQIVHVPEKLVSYRVHKSNTLGVMADKPLPAILSILSFLNPFKLLRVIRQFDTHIRQGRSIFQNNGKKFSIALFWTKMILGRYLMPLIARYFTWAEKHSWKRRES